jgi:hypothetical protein
MGPDPAGHSRRRRGRSRGRRRACLRSTRAAALCTVAALLAAAPGSGQEPDSTAPATPPPASRPALSIKVLLDLDHTFVSREDGEEDPGFSLRRVRIITQGALNDRTSIRVLLEPSGLALGPTGAAPFRGVPLVEALVEHRILSGLTVRAGQQRLPFGLAASTGAPSLPLPEYPQATHILMQRVSIFRDIGVSVAGRTGALEIAGGVFNGAGINVPSDNNRARDVLGRASFALRPGLSIGASGWRGRTGELYAPDEAPRRTFYDDARFARWGIDARAARGPVHVTAEFLFDRTEHNPGAVNPTPGARDVDRSGWYLMGAYRLRDDLELAARYDRWDPDRALSSDGTTAYVGGIQWYLFETTAPDDPVLGRPLNRARSHSRLMLFAEHLDPRTAPSATTWRLRWELFY